mmetsp:Transcript_32909/g.71808  ORF Transcript_32909/g.71808 Transcript_32909/m.71808 type:complete len:135 (+) Transcript_32909:69-473(+)
MLEALGPSSYVGMQSTTKAEHSSPWTTIRLADQTPRRRHPARVLAETLGENGRAGKSSYDHNGLYPSGCRVNMRLTASASFAAAELPHLTARARPAHRAGADLDKVTLAGASARPQPVEAAASKRSRLDFPPLY